MKRTFMAGVATVDAFVGNDLAFTAKTLTESSLTIGTSNEEVRGGQGAGLLGRYYHTSTFELTLTDALFNLEYIRASVGGEIESSADVLMTEQITVTGSTLTLSKPAVAGFKGCSEGGNAIVWYKKVSDEEFKQGTANGTAVTPAEGDTITAGTYCVKYFYNNNAASKLTIKSDYIPDTYRLVVKENLYAAGENNTSKTKIGHVEIIIPRFQLDGSQDLTMSMSGAATTSLKGSALVAEDCDSCDGDGYYAEMVEIIDGANWADGIKDIAVDGGSATKGQAANIYAIFDKKMPRYITAADIVAPTADTAGYVLTWGTTDGTGITVPAGLETGVTTLTLNYQANSGAAKQAVVPATSVNIVAGE